MRLLTLTDAHTHTQRRTLTHTQHDIPYVELAAVILSWSSVFEGVMKAGK